MFARLFWRYIACQRFNGGCKRDWDAWFEMELARCMHCFRSIDPPDPDWRRERL